MLDLTPALPLVVKETIRFQVVPHPCYSSDLVPSDLWLFVALMKHLKGIHFIRDAEEQAVMGKWFQEEPDEFYSDRFEKLVHCWQLGIE
jgi:hypothetical protein